MAIDESLQRKIKRYVKKRDEVLTSATLDQFIEWAAENGCPFSNRLSAEIAFHKLRTSVRSLPYEMRVASHHWLRTRGYESWID